MKILICSANFAPEPTGIGKYSGDMAAWLASRGHDVRAIAAPPYYPNWRIAEDYRWPLYRREQRDGVDVWRAPIWVPRSPSGFTRILHLLSFAVLSFPIVLRQVFWAPNLVITIAPALVCSPAALLTSRLCGAQAWLHIQDFEVDVAFRMGLLKGGLLERLVLRMEKSLLHRFDIVSSISGRMIERLLQKGVAQERIRYFPNWVDVTHIKPTPSSARYRARLGIAANALVVLFSGTLGGKQGLMVIPAVARLLAARSDVLFVICGDGMMKAELEAASAGLPNLRLLPLQPLESLGELLSMADIHLLPQNSGAADLVLPSKLSGMLASGRPVIAQCLSGTELESVVSQCGVVVPPEDPISLAAAVTQLADDIATRVEMGRRAREYAETNFERDAILGRVFGAFDGEGASIPDDIVA
jgi:colanic acid biosynthesis glycosyl transferase WcaI